jgi:hypothetical protein
MKIVVTYESADISRLIRQDLARQGITATDADIKYAKGVATVSVEVDPDDVPAPPPPMVAPMPVETTVVTEHAPPRPPSPKLEAIEGGAGPVDMSAVFRDSQKIAATTQGKFPAPKQHQMLEGESHEWPGSPGEDR